MKKLTNLQLKEISKNLDFFFDKATKKDIESGMKWYKNANNIVLEISKKYYLQPYLVAQVISALSPRNKWEQNIKDCDKVCEAYTLNMGPNDVKVCTFNTNKFKAFNILNGVTKITSHGSLKTYNFVNNIAFLHPDFVAVDVWHSRACFKDSNKDSKIGKIAYNQIKELTINKAKKLGLYGYEYQAIIWLSVQRYFKNNKNK